MPLPLQDILQKILDHCKIVEIVNMKEEQMNVEETIQKIIQENPKLADSNAALIPETLFYNIPYHIQIMKQVSQDFTTSQNVLLIGNQGVGKNKIADKFLSLIGREREYIQLHRDSTVQSLTVVPVVKNGIVHYEDSPLVRSVMMGRVLVIDEADKAPLEVVCIIKSLLEDQEMNLSDGRKITLKVFIIDVVMTCFRKLKIHQKMTVLFTFIQISV